MSTWHDWHDWDNYLNVHDSHMDRYRDYFITEDRLTTQMTPRAVLWSGELICADGFEIHVHKKQEVEYRGKQPFVRTVKYSYQVLRRIGDGATNQFRYDNVHVHEDHPDQHHRHQYDAQGDLIEPAQHIGFENWPNLGEIIEETYQLWERHQKMDQE